MANPRLPSTGSRTALVGRSGTGKTQAGAWLLSTRDFDKRPWIIFNSKGDELLNRIPAVGISIQDDPPTEAGLYVVRPLPKMDDIYVDEFFQNCWQQENIGLYFDEGYSIPKFSSWLLALLTQGRSKQIEMIILSQRPKKVSPEIFSEADFFGVFDLAIRDDRKTIAEYTGENEFPKLQQFYWWWYDVNKDITHKMSPVPSADTIIEYFTNRIITIEASKRPEEI